MKAHNSKEFQLKYIIPWIALLSISLGSTSIQNIHYSIKENGIMVNIDMTAPIQDDDIIGWKSDQGWVYLTILGVRLPARKMPFSDLKHPLKEIKMDDFKHSTQLAFLIGRPIVGFDIINSQTHPNTIVFIHTEMKKSKVANLKNRIVKDGNSVFQHANSHQTKTNKSDFRNKVKKTQKNVGSEKQSALITIPDSEVSSQIDIQEELDDDLLTINETDDQTLTLTSSQIEHKNNQTLWKLSSKSEAIESMNGSSTTQTPIQFPESMDQDFMQGRFDHSASTLDIEMFSNGGIAIKTNMADIPIYVDGKYVGDTPIVSIISVEPGWHQVSNFKPVQKNALGLGKWSFVSNDHNNQAFGVQTVYVESGKISEVRLKYNELWTPSIKPRELKGGGYIGVPMVAVLLFFISLL